MLNASPGPSSGLWWAFCNGQYGCLGDNAQDMDSKHYKLYWRSAKHNVNTFVRTIVLKAVFLNQIMQLYQLIIPTMRPRRDLAMGAK